MSIRLDASGLHPASGFHPESGLHPELITLDPSGVLLVVGRNPRFTTASGFHPDAVVNRGCDLRPQGPRRGPMQLAPGETRGGGDTSTRTPEGSNAITYT